MQCEEREKLWEEYSDAVTALSAAADLLKVSVNTPQVGDAVAQCETVNQRCKITRASWERHLREHRCDRQP